MKQEQILKLADQAGFYVQSREIFTPKLEHLPINEAVEKLILLVEQATLERAARECIELANEMIQDDHHEGCVDCENAIRNLAKEIQ